METLLSIIWLPCTVVIAMLVSKLYYRLKEHPNPFRNHPALRTFEGGYTPNKPTGPPPPPPTPIPKVYGNYNPTFVISTPEILTKENIKKMQEELLGMPNPLFAHLTGKDSFHRIPILEPPKRKEENHEPIKKPKRKITY